MSKSNLMESPKSEKEEEYANIEAEVDKIEQVYQKQNVEKKVIE